MDWETLLAFVGLYVIALGDFVYNYYMSKRLLNITKDSQRVLSLIEIVMDSAGKKNKGGGE